MSRDRIGLFDAQDIGVRVRCTYFAAAEVDQLLAEAFSIQVFLLGSTAQGSS